ncbi:Gfo/Idh/MocA family protein [Pseudomonas sp. UBA1879]|uniref:Gfo/Idh/MocA family protein n=1 Tax=Pseudomonas sp. UBA1879 TaxID=1947305 RepID=UPI0025EBD967|nr:Gfo/Idh/MocA family oxidoreductase [Pseudomonas sp. UBA1879]
MSRELKVGIIGVNLSGGWAGEAHVPAVRAVDGMQLHALATRDQRTADAAASAFGVAKGYGSGQALIDDPEIDIVTVATRVPDHHALLLAAIAAGKHVYSEWPLGLSAQQARQIADAARVAGVKHAIGLQLRGSRAVQYAQQCLAQGAIGRVLSVRAYSSTAGFGPQVPPLFAYLEDPNNFANLVTIQGAHTLDLVVALGGAPTSLSALTSRQYPHLQLGEPPQPVERRTFDHLLVQGRLACGVPFSVEVAGGRQQGTPFYLDIVGERGTLRLDGGALRGLQAGRVGVLRDGARAPIDEGSLAALSDSAVNVAGLYSALRDDIRTGSSKVLGFDHAVRLTQLIEQVLAKA